MDGKLLLDEMISKRMSIDDINKGFDDLEKGKLARGLIIF